VLIWPRRNNFPPQAYTIGLRHKANVYNILRRTGSMIAIMEYCLRCISLL
jgi:hypothetical protein